VIQTPEDLHTLPPTELLATWVQLSKQLKFVKNLESVGRTLCIQRFYSENFEGSNELNLGNGFSLVAVRKMNYKIEADIEEVEQIIEAMCQVHDNGAEIAARLFKKKYSIDEKEYHSLPLELMNIVNTIVSIEDATPTLTLKEPKVKR